MTIADRLREEGLQKGIELGKQEGIELGVKAVATKMLIAGQSIDFIVQLTGLTEGEVKKLKNGVTH